MARYGIAFVLIGLALGCGDDDATPAAADASADTAPDSVAPDSVAPDSVAPDSSEPEDDTIGSDTAPALGIAPSEFTVGDFVFEAQTAGPTDGELVLLLHGFPQTSAAWTSQLTALAGAGYRAVAFDQRGYSPRARPEDVADYALPLLVADVLGVADALGEDKFHLVGHDWGSAVAWTLGARFPERLYTLTTLSVPHPDAYERARRDPASCQSSASGYIDFLVRDGAAEALLAADAAGLRFFWQGLGEASIEAYLRVLGTPPALDAALDWYRANLGPDAAGIDTGVGPVTVPTLFMWGDGDPAVCEDGPNLTAEYVSGPYRFEVIEGAGHWLPELAASAVTTFLLEHLAANR